MSRSGFQLRDLTPQPLDLPLLGLHQTMAGKCLHWIGAELLHPLAQNILVNVQVAAGLHHLHPAFADQLDRFDLELATELPSLHCPPPAS